MRKAALLDGLRRSACRKERVMRHLLKAAALVGAVAATGPAWAQSSEDLNAQEPNRFNSGAPVHSAAPAAPLAYAAPGFQQPATPQAYAAPGYPQQAYPQQAYPQQAYPQVAYPEQGYPQQAYPQQVYPNAYPYPYPYQYPYYGYDYSYYDYPYYDYGYPYYWPVGAALAFGFHNHFHDHFHGGFNHVSHFGGGGFGHFG